MIAVMIFAVGIGIVVELGLAGHELQRIANAIERLAK